ncbi:hypothetical protein KFU94_61570 [Chloroflexi bacterium TSY]|nr:hypothetical protein [Chloroflexi bacterium TSY]
MSNNSAEYRAEGYVTAVNQPGNGSFDQFTVRQRDTVRYATYAPKQNDYLGTKTWYAAGSEYNMFIIDSEREPGTQAFIVWSSQIDGYLRKVHNPVYAIGVGNDGVANNTLKRGDLVKMMWGGDDSTVVDVTVDVWRENEAVATFSFRAPNPYPSTRIDFLHVSIKNEDRFGCFDRFWLVEAAESICRILKIAKLS